MSSLFLSDAEVAEICAPLTQPAAQIRYLRRELGLQVKQKPNGKPLVLRSSFEAAKVEVSASAQPDVGALLRFVSKGRQAA